MSRKLDAADAGDTRVLSIRLTPRVYDALMAEAARRSTAAGGVPVSAAAVGRTMIERALLELVVPTTPIATPAASPSVGRPGRERRKATTKRESIAAEQYTDDELRAVVQAAGSTERARAVTVGVSPTIVHRFLHGEGVSAKTRATLVQYASARGNGTE